MYNGGVGQGYADILKTNLAAFYAMNNVSNYATDSTGNYTGSEIGTPSGVPGKVLETASDGDQVYQALDQFASANHTTQTVFGEQPLFTSNIFRTDGSSDNLDLANVQADLSALTTGTIALWV